MVCKDASADLCTSLLANSNLLITFQTFLLCRTSGSSPAHFSSPVRTTCNLTRLPAPGMIPGLTPAPLPSSLHAVPPRPA